MPVGFDYGTSSELGEMETPAWRAQTKFVCTKTQREGAMTQQETKPKLSPSVGRSLVEVWISRGSPQGWRHWQQQSRKVSLAGNLFDVATNLTIKPVNPKAGSPQAKQPTGREQNPTNKQIMGL